MDDREDTAADRSLFGHPRGLGFIAATELWDRVSFHGMQALLVLYMVDQLLLPDHAAHILGFAGFRAGIEAVTGPLARAALASQIFGLYIGLIYLTPFLGGLVGDRWIGRKPAVIAGGLLMALGHSAMAFDAAFLIALALLIVGAGLLRGNLAVQLSDLYAPEDRRRAVGFQIYQAMVNVGGFVAPIATGALAYAYGWHVGFGFAGVGMLIGLIVYLAGSRHLPAGEPRRTSAARPALTAVERRTVAIVLAVPLLMLPYWIAQSQVWNMYNVWARDHVRLFLGPMPFPVPWLQAVDALGVIIGLPFVLRLWKIQARAGREPDDLAKLAIGFAIFTAAILWLALGQSLAGAGKVPLAWVLAFHLICDLGYLYIVPVAMALVSRAAPAPAKGRVIGAFYFTLFIGGLVSGRLGSLYETLPPTLFWLIHAGVMLAGTLLVLVSARPLRRALGQS